MGLKLLCIVAHPDDECFAFGGALLLAADRGVETSVLCLTDGQAAANRGTAESPAALGKMRRREFAASCDVLGVRHHELLDYQDGQLEFLGFPQVAGQIVERIRAFQPHVVLTFGADGGANTHPDHTMVSAFATTAFHWAGSVKRFPEAGAAFQPERLFHITSSFFLPDRPRPLPIPWTVTLDIRAVMHRKQEAFRQHLSQAPLMEKTRAVFAEHGGEERYTLMASREAAPARQSTDFFEGLPG